MEVIGGADKYQAVCRKCYGGLMVDKENSSPFRNETPQNALIGKLVDSGVPRKLFSSLHLWRRNKDLVYKFRHLIVRVCVWADCRVNRFLFEITESLIICMSAKEYDQIRLFGLYLVSIWWIYIYIIYLTHLITLNLSKQPAVTEFSVLVISVTLV